jgi:hypothetical protein
VRTHRSRSRRRALLPILLALALSLGATAAAGLQPSTTRELDESAFVPVTVNSRLGNELDGTSDGAAAQPNLEPIADPWLIVTDSAERARPALPEPKPLVVTRPIATPKSTSSSTTSTTHSISGRASWYCDAGVSPCTADHPDTSGFDAYAAAGPRLRAAVGSSWRGKIVYVDGVRVKLIDWCQCYQGESNEKLLDLYHDVYLRTGSAVTIRW